MRSQRARAIVVVAIIGVWACGKDAAAPLPTSSGILTLSPPTVDFTAIAGGGINPGPGIVSVTNGTSDTLRHLRVAVEYMPGESVSWINQITFSATTTPSTMTLSIITGSVSVGTHSAIVAVSADGATNGPQTIAVTFTVRDNGIYVSTTDPQAADDAGCGLGPTGSGANNHPCRTILQGQNRATITLRPTVFVADGVYDEPVTLINNTNVLGGYRPDTWERHVATTNTIIQGSTALGPHRATVRADLLNAPVVFEGFVVRGPVNVPTGGNSYAILVSSLSAKVAIRRNVIIGGRGGPGAAGAAGANGAAGVAGTGRAADSAAYDAFITSGSGACDAGSNRTLANGGAATFGGDVVDGGRGGSTTCPTSSSLTQLSAGNGVGGQAGAGGATGGPGGTGGSDARDTTIIPIGQVCALPPGPVDGASGTVGSSGADGNSVSGGATGAGGVSGGFWVGDSGQTGAAGGNGAGGGGGGAGAGAHCANCVGTKDRLGGVGGGGGSGGEGGGGGGRGTAGGAAFGVFVGGGFLGDSAPTLTDNTIVRGDGGAGGSGGNGGRGGDGGAGGDGGEAIFCTGSGGNGGDGGAGGHGSGGGGGSGGASFGIYTSGIGTPTYCDMASNNTITGGTGGAAGSGGSALINPGGAGQTGTVAGCSFH